MPIRLTGKDVKTMLEPPILVPGLNDDDEVFVSLEHLQASQAISLKRIADSLDRLGGPEMANNLTHIAWEMGRNFQHGVKTG